MERFPYLLRHGFDPTDCDNADNYYDPSDPLGPGPSSFGQQHQCHPRPLRPIPTDPFQAFRLFNRLQGLNECEAVERAAFAYLNRPQPSIVKHRRQEPRKVKAEKPDIIELFHGDELPNLYFYNPLHELLKQKPILSWLFGFTIVPGDVPNDAHILPPSALASRALSIVESNLPDSEDITPILHEETEDIEVSEASEDIEELPTPYSSPISYVRITPNISRVKSRALSSYAPRRLSATCNWQISMKGFVRLGVSLIKRDRNVVIQSDYLDCQNVVREFVICLPHIQIAC